MGGSHTSVKPDLPQVSGVCGQQAGRAGVRQGLEPGRVLPAALMVLEGARLMEEGTLHRQTPESLKWGEATGRP